MIHSTIYYQLELKFQKYPVAMIEKAQLKNAQKANFRIFNRSNKQQMIQTIFKIAKRLHHSSVVGLDM